jgi:transcriptional regulator with XRE-family HTH domain
MWRVFGNRGKNEPSHRQLHGGEEPMMTAAQCRSARTLLGWSVSKLASAASVTESAIDDFEMERRAPGAATADAIRRVFEDVGVEFTPDDDVRLRANGTSLR